MQTSSNKSYLIFFGALCFSTSGTIQALAPDGATPYVVTAIRTLMGGILLLAWCFFTKKLKRGGTWPLTNLIMSVLSMTVFQLSFFIGVLEVGVAVGTMIAIGVAPLVVAAMGFVVLKEVPQKEWYISTVISITGLVLLNLNSAENVSLWGIALPIIAGLSYATYFIFSKALVKDNSPVLVTMVLSFCVAILLFPAFFIFPIEWIFTVNGLFVSFFLGFVTMALAYSLMLAGQKHTNVSTSATISLSEPLGAACLGILFLGEQASLTVIAGMICILVSVLVLIYLPMINMRRKKV